MCMAMTETKFKIYNAVYDFIQKNHYSPTMREICDQVGLKSTSTAYMHIMNLIEDGFLEGRVNEGSARTITLPKEKYEMIFWKDLLCLPEDNKEVLVKYKDKMYTAVRIKDRWEIYTKNGTERVNISRVTGWAEMPE